MKTKKVIKQLKTEVNKLDNSIYSLLYNQALNSEMIKLLTICGTACTFDDINILREAEPYLKLHAKYMSTLTDDDRVRGVNNNVDEDKDNANT